MALEELKELVSSGEEIDIRNVKVVVNEFSLKDLPLISSKTAKIKHSKDGSIPTTILNNIEVFYDIVSISTGEKVDNIKKLSIPEFSELASKVVEVNMNLFLEKILPKIEALSEKITNSTGQN